MLFHAFQNRLLYQTTWLSGQWLAALIFGLGLFATSPKIFANQEEIKALNHLHILRVEVRHALINSYMLLGHEADPRYHTALKRHMSHIKNQLLELASLNHQHFSAYKVKELSESWKQVSSLLEANFDHQEQFGITDENLMIKLLKVQEDLNKFLDKAYEEAAAKTNNVSQVTLLARQQSLLMQEIASYFAAKTALAYSDDSILKTEEEQMNQLIDSLSAGWKNLYETAAASATELGSDRSYIETKWEFIKRAMNKRRRDEIAIMVYMYCNMLTERTEQIAKKLSRTNLQNSTALASN